jgi:pimeloyl-ACP methyl ester carboxylesterase
MLWTILAIPAAVVVYAGLRWVLVAPEVAAETLQVRYGGPPSRFVELGPSTIARYQDFRATEEGDGDATIVLLHGGNLSLESFQPWIERLRGRTRVVAVDLPGHGLTGATGENDYGVRGLVAFVASFTSALGLVRPFVLAGHSAGGHVAWQFTLQHPERILKLVLVAPGGIEPPGGAQSAAIRLASLPGGQLILPLLLSRKRMEAGLKTAFYETSKVTADMVDRYWTMSRRRGTRAATIARLRAASVDPIALARLSEIKIPTLILWGENDVVFSLNQSRAFVDAIPSARLVACKNCGHFPIEEAPDHTFAELSTFLD